MLSRKELAGSDDQQKPQTQPASPEGLLARLDTALARGQNDQARGALMELLRYPDLKADVLLMAGMKLAQYDLYEEASRPFSRCVKDHPELFEGHYDLALSELALGNLPQALASIEKAPHVTRQDAIARVYLRGKIEAAMGRPSEAERDLVEAFTTSPKEENYALDLGLFYLRQREYPRAVEVFQKASASSASLFVWFGLSLAQFLRGQPAESLETCHRILTRDDSFSPARTLLAFLLYLGGRYQEAEKAAAAGLGSSRPYPYLYYVRAAAGLRLQSEDYAGMLSDLALAAKGIPACGLCYFTQSKVHQAMGHRDEAITDLEESTRLDPYFAEAWYRLASLYDQAGRHGDASTARTQFNKAKGARSKDEADMIRNALIDELGGGSASSH